MPRPTVTVDLVDKTPPRGLPTDTGVAFVVGFTDSGPLNTATKINTLDQFVDTFGGRVGHGLVYDWLAAAFDDGLATVYVSRVGGPAATEEDDDNANATDADWQTALDAMGRALGPGQVAAPGRTTTAAHLQLVAHAADNNRVALLDGPDAADAAALAALADAALTADDWRGGMFGPWVDIVDPDLATATRAVPGSAVAAGRIAATDASDGLGQPAAGRWGQSKALAVRTTFTDSEWDTLADAGVSLIVDDGGVRIGDFVSVTADPDLRLFTGARIAMGLIAEVGSATNGFQFTRIDGEGRALAGWGGQLTSIADRYFVRGDLFGATSDEAFDVDVSAAQNPLEDLAAGQARARVRFRPSPFARDLWVNLERHRIDQALSA